MGISCTSLNDYIALKCIRKVKLFLGSDKIMVFFLWIDCADP
jgi:hypothetical protein